MMARPYTDSEREKIKEDLLQCVLKLIHEKGYIHTSVTNIAQAAGISKAYFYTLFPSKEVLITEALKKQEKAAVEKASEIARMQGIPSEEKLQRFLEWLAEVINDSFFFLTPDEAGDVSRQLSFSEREQFFVNLVRQQKKILAAFGIYMNEEDIRVFGNLIINLFMICSSRGKDYCYYDEALDDSIHQLIKGIVAFVSECK